MCGWYLKCEGMTHFIIPAAVEREGRKFSTGLIWKSYQPDAHLLASSLKFKAFDNASSSPLLPTPTPRLFSRNLLH